MRQPQDHSRIDVSVVVPAHNEEGNIGPLLDQFGEMARSARFTFEVVLVDDGSTDRTLAKVADGQKNHRFVRLVSLPFRRGLTEALRAGFAVARGGIIVFYPADRQFHPNDIPKMVEKVREGYDLVTGRKIGEYDKKVVSGIYNRLSRMLFPSIPVTDLNSVKAFRRELTDVFDYRHDWHRFWVAIVAEAGYRVGEVDVTLYKRRAGKSKFGFWRIPGGLLDLLAVKFQYHMMRRPLWYFGMTGSILLVAAFGLGLWALYQRFVMGHGYRPLLYLVMTLGITGIVFFTLGFLAESVAGIREQLQSLRGSPRYGIRQVPSQGRSLDAPPSPTPAPPSPLRSVESPRSSDNSRRRRGGGADRRPGQSDRRSSRSRRPAGGDGEERASEVLIRRRSLESDGTESGSPSPESHESGRPAEPLPPARVEPKPEESTREVAADDLFSDAGDSQDDVSPAVSDFSPPSSVELDSPAAKPAGGANETAAAPREPRAFGRRNRR
jgi:glycosyltransferase involved in cell wall biosynthesis